MALQPTDLIAAVPADGLAGLLRESEGGGGTDDRVVPVAQDFRDVGSLLCSAPDPRVTSEKKSLSPSMPLNAGYQSTNGSTNEMKERTIGSSGHTTIG